MTLATVLVMLATYAAMPAHAASEPALGSPGAAVTLVEYGSLTCGHCIRFHRAVMPDVKRRYIDTGRVRFIFRDFPTNSDAMRGAVAARCVRREAYYPTLAALFKSVAEWSRSSDVDAALQREVGRLELDDTAFRACQADSANEARINHQRRQAAKDFGVMGTPTFLVNGRVVESLQTLDQIAELIVNAEKGVEAPSKE